MFRLLLLSALLVLPRPLQASPAGSSGASGDVSQEEPGSGAQTAEGGESAGGGKLRAKLCEVVYPQLWREAFFDS